MTIYKSYIKISVIIFCTGVVADLISDRQDLYLCREYFVESIEDICP